MVLSYTSVGGGSAGSILALRLSENKNTSILLIEAGVSTPDVLNIPALGPLKQVTDLNWHYRTVPQKHSCFGLENNSSLWPSGKVLGGTSHLNYMIHLRGHENDFSLWRNPESEEWNFRDLKNYFDKAEEHVSDIKKQYKRNFCAKKKGSISVREATFTTSFSNSVLRAAQEIGYNITNLNSEGNTGFMKPLVNVNTDGKRWTADQRLKDELLRRPNMKVLTSAVVERILLRNSYEAYGVDCIIHGKKQRIFAKEEIIISAGTVGSAKLLMLSGIGPKDVLSKANIRTKIELPVGKNLQDHITTGLDLIILNKTIFSTIDLANLKSAYEYFINGRGPFTSSMVDAIGLIYSDVVNSELLSPDLEFMVMMAGASSDGGLLSKNTLGISDKVWNGYFSLLSNAVSILPVLLHPKSIGKVELDSNDPRGQPLIDPMYLSNKEDIATLIKGIRIIQKIVNTKSMIDFGARFNNLTFPGCEAYQFDSKEYWTCYVRHLTLTSYHPVGTCKMGSWNIDKDSVVDHRLRVHKTNKLRIIDASIMPSMPSANTNAAVVMIAEKGADLIKEDYYKRRLRSTFRDILFQRKKCDITWRSI